MTHHAAVDATCVSTGNVEYWTCSTCSLNYDGATGGNVIDDVTTAIDSTNHVHTTISKPEVAPDCENTGLTAEISCADCDKVLEEREEVPALGHDMAPATCQTPSTCKNGCGLVDPEGKLGHHTNEVVDGECDVCGEALAESEVNATLTFDANKAENGNGGAVYISTGCNCLPSSAISIAAGIREKSATIEVGFFT